MAKQWKLVLVPNKRTWNDMNVNGSTWLNTYYILRMGTHSLVIKYITWTSTAKHAWRHSHWQVLDTTDYIRKTPLCFALQDRTIIWHSWMCSQVYLSQAGWHTENLRIYISCNSNITFLLIGWLNHKLRTFSSTFEEGTFILLSDIVSANQWHQYTICENMMVSTQQHFPIIDINLHEWKLGPSFFGGKVSYFRRSSSKSKKRMNSSEASYFIDVTKQDQKL